MRKLTLQQLAPGMVILEDVLSRDQKIIVPAGVVITDNIISRLEAYSIFDVSIQEQIEQETLSLASTDMLSKNHYLPAQNQTQEFMGKVTSFLTSFRESVLRTYKKNMPLNVEQLSEQFTIILKRDEFSANHLFGMLLEMHQLDESIFSHSINVALISNCLARWLHFPETTIQTITGCGLFHDIGKLYIPTGILNKPDKLTDEEFEIIKTHTTEGYHLLNQFPIDQHIKDTALMHHEKCDGSGYPYGLTRESLSNFTKIVTIADIFDAMTSERIYRSSLCPFDVIRYFEDDGLQKYETEYIMTFLENVTNSYLNHKVTLSNGMDGTVVFINKDKFAQPTVKCNNEFWDLSKKKNIHIEAIF